MPRYNIEVAIDPRRARAGARQVDRALDTTRSRANMLRRTLTAVFTTAAVFAGVRGLIGTIASFGQAMSTVQAITQATGEQFTRLREEAKQLGATTRFSATQAAEGMLFLARAGFNTEQVLESVEGTLRLAQAGAIDLGSAADIASNILTGFRLRAEETGRVVDVLALGANSANTDIRQLGDAMKFVAPVAAGLGVEIETATAAIGALSDAGLQASLAGTGLRRVLSELESPSTKTAAILNDLMVSTDQVRVSQVGLINALQTLRDAGIDTGLALEIFGDRGGPAFEVLSNAIPRVRELEENLRNAGGTADRVSAIMDDNLNGALLRTRSAAEAVVLAFGDLGADDALTRAFNALAESLRFVADNIDLVTQAGTTLFGVFVLNKIFALAAGVAGLSGVLTGAAAAAGLLLRTLIIPALAIDSVFLLIGAWDEFRQAVELIDFDLVLFAFARTVDRIIGVSLELPIQFALILDQIRALFFAAFRAISDTIVEAFESAIDRVLGRSNLEQIDQRLSGVRSELQSLASQDELLSPDDMLLSLNRASALMDEQIDLLDARRRLLDRIDGQTESFTESIERNYRELASQPGLADVVGATRDFFSDSITDIVFSPEERARLEARSSEVGGHIAEGLRDGIENTLTGQFLEAGGLLDGILDSIGLGRGATVPDFTDELRGGVIRGQGTPSLSPTTPADATSSVFRREETDAYTTTLRDLNREIEQQGALLEQTNAERMISAELFEVINSLAADDITLTARQRDELTGLIETRQRQQRQLEIEDSLYQSIRGSADTYAESLAGIERLLKSGVITAMEAADAQRDLRIEFLRTQTTFEAGVERGILGLQRQLNDFSDLSERAITNAFRGAEDALVDFVTTGKLSVNDLVRSIIADFARIQIRQNILGPLLGAFGFSGASFASGGIVRGPGSGTSDSIATALAEGSFVVNARAASAFRPILDGISGFASGGLVPVRISNGEYVVPPGAARRNAAFLSHINSAVPAFQQGGSVPASGGRAVTQVVINNNGALDEDEIDVRRRPGDAPDGGDAIEIRLQRRNEQDLSGGRYDGALSRRYGLRPVVS